MSTDDKGSSPRWQRQIRRGSEIDPARSDYIDSIIARYRRDQQDQQQAKQPAGPVVRR